MADYFGLTLGASAFTARLDDADLSDQALSDGVGVYADQPSQPILNSAMVYLGIIYNFDI